MAEPLIAPPQEPANTEPGGTEKKEPEKTYTEADVAGLKDAWEKELAKQLAQAKKEGQEEAERLSKLSAEEKVAEQMKKLREENEALRKSDARTKLEADARKQLETAGLPAGFLGLVMAEDAERMKKNVKDAKALFDAAVTDAVEVRLRGKTPPGGSGAPSTEADEIQTQIRKIIEGGR